MNNELENNTNEVSEVETGNVKQQLTTVTTFSKYLALALFVALPFIGGWIGYTYAPENVVEVEKIVINEVEVELESNVFDVSSWNRFYNETHGFSFLAPVMPDWEVFPIMEMESSDRLGTSLWNKIFNAQPIFEVEVIYTPEWSSIGSVFEDVEALEEGLNLGGAKQIALLSQEVNRKEDKNAPSKRVGDIEEFQYQNEFGYGFFTTDTFDYCFNVERECGSGQVIYLQTNIVYLYKEDKVYRVKYLDNSDTALEIFKSLEL